MQSLFERLEELDLKEVIDQQLKLQVDVPWPKEVECLEAHGLKDAHSVLDVGTGNGYLLCRLAQRYPDKKFTGIEVSESLVKIARETAKNQNLSNIEIINAECPVSNLKGNYDFVLARLAMYCAKRRGEILSWVYDLLNDSGRMAIEEVDVGYAYSFPQGEAWDKLFKALESIDSDAGSDPFLGRKLPYMLQAAGFRDVCFEQKYWYSSIDMTPDQFLHYWTHDSFTVHKIMPDYFSKEDLDKFRVFFARDLFFKNQHSHMSSVCSKRFKVKLHKGSKISLKGMCGLWGIFLNPISSCAFPL